MRIIQENGKYLVIPESPEEIDQMNVCLFPYCREGIETKFAPGNKGLIIPMFASAKAVRDFVKVVFEFQQRIWARRYIFQLVQLDLQTISASLIHKLELQQVEKIHGLIVELFSKLQQPQQT